MARPGDYRQTRTRDSRSQGTRIGGRRDHICIACYNQGWHSDRRQSSPAIDAIPQAAQRADDTFHGLLSHHFPDSPDDLHVRQAGRSEQARQHLVGIGRRPCLLHSGARRIAANSDRRTVRLRTRVGQNQTPDPFGVSAPEGEGHIAAHAQPRHYSVPDPEVIEQRGQIIGVLFHGEWAEGDL